MFPASYTRPLFLKSIQSKWLWHQAVWWITCVYKNHRFKLKNFSLFHFRIELWKKFHQETRNCFERIKINLRKIHFSNFDLVSPAHVTQALISISIECVLFAVWFLNEKKSERKKEIWSIHKNSKYLCYFFNGGDKRFSFEKKSFI